jgi:hypothetical protein
METPTKNPKTLTEALKSGFKIKKVYFSDGRNCTIWLKHIMAKEDDLISLCYSAKYVEKKLIDSLEKN